MPICSYYSSLEIPSERRQILLDYMQELAGKGVDCSHCSGNCCDFSSNSMQIDYLQGIELLYFLECEKKDFLSQLKQTVTDYRLDYDLDTGYGSALRRTYRCPFYTPGPKGCVIAWEYRPYGCLAFNRSEQGNCILEVDLLLRREEQFNSIESAINERIKKDWGLWRVKAPIPVILLDLYRTCAARHAN